MIFFVGLLALAGHAFLWVAMINRLHGSRIEGRWRDAATLLAIVSLVVIPIGFGWWLWPFGPAMTLPWPAAIYLGLCWIGAAVALAGWFRRHVFHRPPAALRYERSCPAGGSEPAERGEDRHHVLTRLPGNEILRLHVVERGVEIARLPQTLARLSIVHVSDFHFTGRIGKSYFLEVVRRVNGLDADLVCITGDLIDDAACFDWIPQTLGQLAGRHGVYFVLGNHDRLIDHRRLRQVLTASGLVDLGGRWLAVDVRGQPVLLAGNERPWFHEGDELARAPQVAGDPLRIALTHSPDQLRWAQAAGVDLLLAGHTHGGQIRLPLVGPIFSPCRHGVKHAWGLYEAPPTLLHVTCGVSGEFPVRMNCPPEIVRLVLQSPFA